MTQKNNNKGGLKREQELTWTHGEKDVLCPDTIHQIKLVRVGRSRRSQKITDAEEVFDFWQKTVTRQPWFDEDRETSIAIMLDKKMNVKAWNLVSIGTDGNCFLDIKGVFRCAVACSASSVIVVHNHPSGECEPSPNDLCITTGLVKAGQILGIQVLDHLVIGGKQHCSFRDRYPYMFGVRKEVMEPAAADATT